MRFFCVTLIVCFSSALLFGGDPSRNHDIAQVGDGGGIRTVFWISNGNSESVKLTLELFADDGKPLEIELDGTRASKFEITVAAKGTRKLSTPGTGLPQAWPSRSLKRKSAS